MAMQSTANPTEPVPANPPVELTANLTWLPDLYSVQPIATSKEFSLEKRGLSFLGVRNSIIIPRLQKYAETITC